MEIDFLNLLFVLLAAWLAGNVAERYQYPSVLGELLAGILLGPPLLGFLYGTDAIAVLAEIGVLLMMLYIGMEIDPRELGKASWGGLLAAVGGFITPFVLAYFAVIWFGGTTLGGLFVGIAAGITSLATKSRILVDLRLLDTRVAHVLLAGALISDTMALVTFAAIMGLVDAGTLDAAGIAVTALQAILFFAVTAAVGYKVFPWVGRKLTEAGFTGRTFNFTMVLLLAVAFGELAELAGLHSILGAFIAGLFLQDNVLGRSLSQDLTRAVREASIGFLAPIFFVTAGFEVSFSVFVGADLALFLVIMAVAIFGKILGTVLFYLPTGHGWREGVTLGMGMNGRGAVEIIVAGIGLEQGLISQEIFSILVFMAIFTTATVPALLKWSTDWLRNRGELVRSREERRGTIVVGAGPLARTLAATLERSDPVRIVDSNPRRCSLAEAEGRSVVRGNALQEQILSEADAGRAESLVALTANREVNALVAQMANGVFSIPEIHVMQAAGETAERGATMVHLGATTLFGGPIELDEWDHRVSHGWTEEVPTVLSEPVTGAALLETLRGEDETPALPLALSRDGRWLPVHSNLELGRQEEVRLLRAREREAVERDRFDRIAARSPVLDLEGPMSAEEFFDRAAAELSETVAVGRDALALGLLRREAASSTVLAPGLAVPHVVLDDTPPPPEEGDRFAMLIARSRSGISFPGQPEPVRAIFVLVDAGTERAFHLRALSAIAQIAQNPSFEEKWRTARDPEELRRLVLEADRRRYAEAALRTG